MPVIGKTSEELAIEFVSKNPRARLGSKSPDGLRRIVCDGDGRDAILAEFSKIGVTKTPAKQVASKPVSNAPLPCIHRGSQRHTCCGSPELWICRELKTDCVADAAAATKLRSMVATQEASEVKVCSTCQHRTAAIAAADPWPAIRQRDNTTPRVGFISAAYMPIGGTETFHQSLLPRLRSVVDVAGFVATGFHGGDGSKLHVPYATGVEAAQRLAAHCDIIIAWGIHELARILPARRPRVIAVHHSDWTSDWNNRTILNQLDLIDEIICVNEDTAKRIAACGKRTYCIPNAIDPERIIPSGKQAELRVQFGISSGPKIVLFGHRLSAEKRPALAVEIARNLPADWTMVIAGEGLERDSVKACAAGCDRVRIVGAVDSLADWLSISDCFLSLSTFEGFGLATCEAMAAGVPTVSTPTGIAPGLATTLPADSTAEEWAAAIVAAKPLVQPADILERFSVERMVGAWTEILKA